MEIKINYIPHNFRNKYLKNVGGYASSSSSNVSGGNGLPYVLDENGNYVVEKQVLFKKSIISKEEVVAYGESDIDYVGTYAPLNHPHDINDITGLQEILDNIGSGGTGSSIEVIDNWESTSNTAALSANQGRVLNELIATKSSVSSWADIKDKPSTFNPSTHNHTITEITGLQVQLDSKASSSHSHSISGITGLSTELSNKANVNHSHSISAITGLQGQLDSKASSSHTHTIANITGLQGQLDSKASSAHTHTIANITNLQTQLDSKVNTSSISTLSVKNSDTVDNLHASSFMRSDANTSCSGNVSIGGDLVVTGEITAYSDRRLKTDIQSLNNRGLLNPVVYTKDNKRQIGFIAQEVQEHYPELVTESNGYLSLNYQQLTAVLSTQINNLYSIINELKLEISRLKNK